MYVRVDVLYDAHITQSRGMTSYLIYVARIAHTRESMMVSMVYIGLGNNEKLLTKRS